MAGLQSAETVPPHGGTDRLLKVIAEVRAGQSRNSSGAGGVIQLRRTPRAATSKCPGRSRRLPVWGRHGTPEQCAASGQSRRPGRSRFQRQVRAFFQKRRQLATP